MTVASRVDRLSEGRFAALTMLPGLVLVGIVVALPVLAVVVLSLFRVEMLRDDLRPFVGVTNYVNLSRDDAFLATLPRTLVFAAASTALAVPVALGSALLVNARRRWAGILGLLLLLPWGVAPIADGVFWRMVFDDRTGLVNAALGGLGIAPVRWTTQDVPQLVVTLVAVTWRATPLLAVLLLGALRRVPPALGAAARMDGASPWQTLRFVTLPAVRPTLIVVCVIQVVLSLQVFDILFGVAAGHPKAGATLAAYAIYDRVIGNLSFGFGSAETVVLGLIVGACLLPLVFVARGGRSRRVSRRDDPGEDGAAPDGRSAAGPGRGSSTVTAGMAAAFPAGASSMAIRAAAPAARATAGEVAARARTARRRPGGRVLALLVRRTGIGVLVAWLLGPMAWLLVVSTQPESALRHSPPVLTGGLVLDGYTRLLGDPAWLGALAVTVTVAVGATAVALLVSVLVAYPLARYRVRGQHAVLGVLLVTQLIPPIALAIPVLVLFVAIGVRGTILGLVIVNAAFWTPILVWLIRAALVVVPESTEAAARMDGAGRVGAAVRVILPAAAPGVAAAAVVVMIGVWNDFVFVASVGNRTTTTLPVFLTTTPNPPYHVLAAGILLTMVPCLVLIGALYRRILAAV